MPCGMVNIFHSFTLQMFWMYGFFWLLNKLGMLRISLGTEALGLDHAAMGENNTRGLLSNDLIIKPNTAAAAMGARMVRSNNRKNKEGSECMLLQSRGRIGRNKL